MEGRWLKGNQKTILGKRELKVLDMQDVLISTNKNLKDKIAALSGQKLEECYLCGKCTAGCPVAPYQDIPPHVVMRLAQWGSKKPLESKMIWRCAACGVCYTRCPNSVDVAKVCEALTRIAQEEGIVSDKAALALREKFVENIKSHGRIHELSLAISMKLISGDILGDLSVGLPMLLKGKLPLKASKIKDLKNFKKLFNKEGVD